MPGAPPGGPQTSGSAVACCGPGRGLANGGTRRSLRGLVQANPQLRPRVGNPDELRSRMGQHWTCSNTASSRPEPGLAEAVDGAVITALNEEAVVSAALGNKGRHQRSSLTRHLPSRCWARCARKSCSRDIRRRQAHHPDGCRWSRLRRPGRTARTSSRTRIRRWPKRCWAKCPTPRACCSRSMPTVPLRAARRLAWPVLDAGRSQAGRRQPVECRAGRTLGRSGWLGGEALRRPRRAAGPSARQLQQARRGASSRWTSDRSDLRHRAGPLQSTPRRTRAGLCGRRPGLARPVPGDCRRARHRLAHATRRRAGPDASDRYRRGRPVPWATRRAAGHSMWPACCSRTVARGRTSRRRRLGLGVDPQSLLSAEVGGRAGAWRPARHHGLGLTPARPDRTLIAPTHSALHVRCQVALGSDV